MGGFQWFVVICWVGFVVDPGGFMLICYYRFSSPWVLLLLLSPMLILLLSWVLLVVGFACGLGMSFDLGMGLPLGFKFCGFCVDFALIFFFGFLDLDFCGVRWVVTVGMGREKEGRERKKVKSILKNE